MKCANGKWKYGAGGSCVFDTLAACKAAAAAIHIQDPAKDMVPLPAVEVEPGCGREDMTEALKDQYR
jgi:hypothetical protein